MKAFDTFLYKDAAELFTKERRTDTAKRAREFFKGNHWQSEWGFIGELPPAGYEGRTYIIDNLKKGFVFENVIFEVTDTHTGGVLGTEPMWDFVRNGEALNVRKKETAFKLGETLTAHWDERKSLQILTEAAEGLVLEGDAVLRLYFPKGLLRADNTLPPVSNIADALKYLYSEVLTSDVAGVFEDPATKRQIGVYLFEEGEDSAKVKKADICYLNEKDETVLRRLTDGKDGSDDFGPYDLGGHLFLHELKCPALITDAVQSDQKCVNLAHTMMARNVNLAGNRTTDIVNGKPPGREETAAASGTVKPAGAAGRKAYKRNPGYVNVIYGLPFYDANGKISGYTNPSINVSEPVSVETFVNTRDHYYAAILGQCFMRHVLISGDATASGRSREQARKEYERSLNKTAVVLNAAGRWQLEVELRMAAHLANDSSVSDLRAVFQCNIEKVPISAEERQENRADLEAGVLDPEEVMRRAGVEDTGAMMQKVEKYQKQKRARAPQAIPPSVEDKTGQGAIG